MPLAAIDPAIGALAVAVIGPLGAYLLAARRFSGKIASSDATDLWAESRSIREWSQNQLDQLTARVRVVENENTALREQVANLSKQLEHANKRVAELENGRTA